MTTPAPIAAPDRAGPASWWSRVGASVLDSLLVNVGAAVLAGVAGIEGLPEPLVWLCLLGAAALFLAYAPLMLAFAGGQTLGRKAANVQVLNDDAQPIGLGRAIVRESVVKLAFQLLVLPWLVSVLWALREPRGRTLHDLMVGTYVVRRPVDALAPAGEFDAELDELDPITRRALRKEGRIR